MWRILGVISAALCGCYLLGAVRLLILYLLGRAREWTPVWDIVRVILCIALIFVWFAAWHKSPPASTAENGAQFLPILSIVLAPWYSRLYKRLCQTNEGG